MVDLFPETKLPRKPRRIIAYMSDAGDAGSGFDCTFHCIKCGWDSGWLPMKTTTQAKRGVPCEVCNSPKHSGVSKEGEE